MISRIIGLWLPLLFVWASNACVGATAPINDTFAQATVLEGLAGSVPISLKDATGGESGEPYPTVNPSIWFRWTAPTTLRVRFSLTAPNPTFAHNLSVFRGTSLANLTAVRAGGTGSNESFSSDWIALPGVTYHIRVSSLSSLDAGATLDWQGHPPVPPPTVVARGSRFLTLRGLPATGESDPFQHRPILVSENADMSDPVAISYLDSTKHDVTIRGLRPNKGYYLQHVGIFIEDLFISPRAHEIGYAETLPDKLPTPGNDFSRPAPLPSGGGSVAGTIKNALASIHSEFPSVWYSFTPSSSGVWKLRVASDDFVPSPTVATKRPDGELDWLNLPILQPDPRSTTPPTKAVEHTLVLRQGTSYLVSVAGDSSGTGAFILSLEQQSEFPPSPNDRFTDALTLTGPSGSAPCDLRMATLESGESVLPLSRENQANVISSVWWRWTSPTGSRVRFTVGRFTFLDVFIGDDLSNLRAVPIQGEQDWGGARVSIAFETTAGQTYYIRAGQPYGLAEHIDSLSWHPATGWRAQSISFTPFENPYDGPSSIALGATATSGLPVSYKVLSGPATLEGDQLVINGVGDILVAALQEGDDSFEAAQPILRTLTVQNPAQHIVFPWPGDRYLGSSASHLYATASSGLPVSFKIVSGPASVSGDELTVNGLGKVVVRATQSGAGAISSALPVEHTFEVVPKPAPVLFLPLGSRTYDGTDQFVRASTFPDAFPVVHTFKDAQGRTLPGPPKDAGTYRITASVDDAEIRPPLAKSGRLVIEKAPLTVFFHQQDRVVGQANPVFTPHYLGFEGSILGGYFGFAEGESESVLAPTRPIGVSSAQASSAAGRYPITFVGGADKNYRFVPSEQPAFLTVLGFGGSYEALLLDGDSLPIGKLELTVPANSLGYTGRLVLASEPVAVTVSSTSRSPGTTVLAPAEGLASAAATWARTKPGVAALSLAVTVSADGSLSGSLDRNGESYATLSGGTQLFTPAKDQKLLWAGAHTLVLHAPWVLFDENKGPIPAGGGYAAATIDAKGKIKLLGKLADGSPLTAELSPAGDPAKGISYRLFTNPYGHRLESFLGGLLTLAPHLEQGRFPNRLYIASETVQFTWQKAESPARPQDKSYRAGFGPLEVPVTLDPWLPPAARATPALPAGTLAQRLGLAESALSPGALALAFGPVDLALGESTDFLPTLLTLDPKGALTVASPITAPLNATKFNLKITPSSGVFTGAFTLSDQVNPPPAKPVLRKVNFFGALQQSSAGSDLGHAFFQLDPDPTDSSSTELISAELRLTPAVE